MADKYTDFDNVDSGESGTIEGLLPLEGSASAFRYRKQIFVVVLGADPTNFNQPIKGRWKVRLRASSARDGENGPYIGAILFEQEVEWVANVTAIGMGMDFITWYPQGPAGSGKQFTSICNAEPCAIIPNISNATEEELKAYGETGAWRFVDNSFNKENWTPGQKYDNERGFVTPDSFVPEGMWAIGGLTFTCEWQSADYVCEGLDEGAILETVSDSWQTGSLDSEAFYTFSYKEGASGFEILRAPRAGLTFYVFNSTDGLICKGTRTDTLEDGADSIIAPTSQRFKPFQNGANLVVVLEDKNKTIQKVESLDWGRTWETGQPMVEKFTLYASCPSADFGTWYLIGISEMDDEEFKVKKGDLIRVIVQTTNAKEESDEEGDSEEEDEDKKAYVVRTKDLLLGVIPTPRAATGTLALDGTTFSWSYRDNNKNVVLLRSTNECLMWEKWQTLPTETPATTP